MRICAASVESAFVRRRAIVKRETCWRKRGVSLVRGMIGGTKKTFAQSRSHAVLGNYVRNVAVPCGFAWPWWKVRWRGAVPVGSAKHAGVSAARRW